MLSNGYETNNKLCLDERQYYLAARSLQRKGLVDAMFDYGEVTAIKLSYEGKAYITTNPTLANPINWTFIISIFTLITSIVALFVGCSLVFHL